MEPGTQYLIIIAFLYFLPWCVALARGHHATGAIFLLTLFLGWTLLGWVAALVWAATEPRWKTERRLERALDRREARGREPADLAGLEPRERERIERLRTELKGGQ